MEWNIDDIRWGQRYVGLEAYMIRNGELAEPVRNPVLELTTKRFYSSIEMKGRELRFYAGICGKGEPAQGVPVWFGGPDVLLSPVKLGVAPCT
jgi:TldD protein